MDKLKNGLDEALKDYCRKREKLVKAVNSLTGTLTRPGGEVLPKAILKIKEHIKNNEEDRDKALRKIKMSFKNFRDKYFSEVKRYFPDLFLDEYRVMVELEEKVHKEFDRWENVVGELGHILKKVMGASHQYDIPKELPKVEKILEEPVWACRQFDTWLSLPGEGNFI